MHQQLPQTFTENHVSLFKKTALKKNGAVFIVLRNFSSVCRFSWNCWKGHAFDVIPMPLLLIVDVDMATMRSFVVERVCTPTQGRRIMNFCMMLDVWKFCWYIFV